MRHRLGDWSGRWRGLTRRRRHGFRAAVAGVCTGPVLALVVAVAWAGPAEAHAELKSITPADGARLKSAPADAVLTFSEPVDAKFTVIKVTGPGGAPLAEGAPQVKGPVVTQPLAAATTAGSYRIVYRTVSVDGHVVSGRHTFTFTPSTTQAQAQQSRPSAAANAPNVQPVSSSSGASRTPWLLVLLFGAVVAALTVSATLAIRRRAHGH